MHQGGLDTILRLLFVIGGILGIVLGIYCVIVAWRSKSCAVKFLNVSIAIVVFFSSLLEFGQAQQPQNVTAPVPSSLHILSVISKSDQPYIESLRARTREVEWQRELGNSRISQSYFQVNDNRIYVPGCVQSDAFCIQVLRPDDGKVLWKTTVHVQEGYDSFEIEKLVFADGIMLVPVKHSILGLDNYEMFGLRVSDGVQVWHVGPINCITVVDGNMYTSDVRCETLDEADTGLNKEYQIKALCIRDSFEIWHFVIHKPKFLQIIAGGELLLLRTEKEITALRASDGAIVWRRDQFSYFYGPRTALYIRTNNNVYGPSYCRISNIMVLRASDGAIVWRYSGGGSLLISHSYLYLQGTQLYAFDILSGKMLWERPLTDTHATTFAEAGGVLYVSDIGSLYALRSRDGALVWQRQEPISDPGNISYDVPIIVNGVIFITEYHSIGRFNILPSLCLSYCVPPRSINALRISDGSLYWRYANNDLVPPFEVSGNTPVS